MKNTTRKPASLPIIAPVYIVKVIDDSGKVPMWKTLGNCYGPCSAREMLENAGLKGGWLFDAIGDREYINV